MLPTHIEEGMLVYVYETHEDDSQAKGSTAAIGG
jgi:hypothetical protein